MDAVVVNDRVWVPAAALSMQAVRASGPGGQNVNKVASKVELRVDLPGIVGLSEAERRRLGGLALPRLAADGRLLFTSQLTRDQGRNLADACNKLRALVAEALRVPKRRKPTRPSRAAVERRLGQKRHESHKKRDRQRRDDD